MLESLVKLYDKRVSQFRYLGIIFTDDMSNSIDSDRVVNKSLRQYNSIYYHRFNLAIREIIYHLLKTYSSSFQRIELWYNCINKNRVHGTVII